MGDDIVSGGNDGGQFKKILFEKLLAKRAVLAEKSDLARHFAGGTNYNDKVKEAIKLWFQAEWFAQLPNSPTPPFYLYIVGESSSNTMIHVRLSLGG